MNHEPLVRKLHRLVAGRNQHNPAALHHGEDCLAVQLTFHYEVAQLYGVF